MRLIDVDALLDDCIFTSKGLEMFMKEFLDDAPTVDAVQVVRCKDCTYCSHFTDGHLECRLLYNLKPVATTYCQMEENDFCSYGKEKEIIK